MNKAYVLLSISLLTSVIAMTTAQTVEINIKPEKYTVASKQVTISCKVLKSVRVNFMEIIKDGNKVIDTLTSSQVSSKNNDSRYVVKGHIDDQDGSNSYLNLEINSPKSKDNGSYVCSVTYFTKSNVPATEQSIQKTLREEKLTVAAVKLALNELNSKKRFFSERVAALKENDKNQLKQIAALQQKLAVIKPSDDNLSKMVTSLTKTVTDLKAVDTRHVKEIKCLKYKASHKCAFSATTNTLLKLDCDAPEVLVRLPVQILKEGTGYDHLTGVFTAPMDGVYAFYLKIAQKYGPSYKLEVESKKDGRKTILGQIAIDLFKERSISTLARLKNGDKVYIRTTKSEPDGCQIRGGGNTLYNGYLIRAD